MGFNLPALLRRRGDNFPLGVPRGASAVLNFASDAYLVGGKRYSFTDIPGESSSGGVNGTVVRDGVIVPASAPRIGDDGLLVEGAATNLLLNSDDLSTQSVTVTAAAHTLSFYGTGTVTLTGVSTDGPLVGTGADDRITLTFTPSAGSLTLTVTGTVENAQLETGSTPTSYIPTEGSAVTRTADSVTLATADLGLADDETFNVIYDDDTTDTISAVSGTLTIPASAKAYARIWA